MNKHDVIRFFGRFPDRIYSPQEAEEKRIMYAKKWTCSKCGEIYEFEIEAKIPAPCIKCGGIGFSRGQNC